MLIKLTTGEVGCSFAGETDCTKLYMYVLVASAFALYANGLMKLPPEALY